VTGLEEIGVVARAELGRSARSGRVIVLLALYAAFSTLVLLVIGFFSQAIDRTVRAQLDQAGADPEAARQAFEQARTGVLGFFFGADEAMVEAFGQIPLVVLLVFKVALFFLPLYVALLGFDQVSGEVGPRSLRYLAVRARRSSLLMGKYLANAALLTALVLVVNLGVFLYARATHEEFGAALMALTLIKFWLAAVVFSLAYLAITTFSSTLFRTPAVSLVFNVLLLFGFWLVGMVARFGIERTFGEDGLPGPDRIVSGLGYLRYFTPAHYADDLLHPHAAAFATSAAAYAAFAVLFLVASWRVLEARDI
jgi:ABC-2 type transport system permease protein